MGLCLPLSRHHPHGRRHAMKPLHAYAAVTAAYWAFMLTDGALRMLVLLHFNALGFGALQLAWLFVLYEVAGIVTNLAAGWIAARFGLAATLYAGLALQIVALAALALLDPAWSIAASVAFVMGVQGLSGVAKDLTKMSSKSAVKLLAPETEGARFRWLGFRRRSGRWRRCWRQSCWPWRCFCPRACLRAKREPNSARSGRKTPRSTGCRWRGCSCSGRAMCGSWWGFRFISSRFCRMAAPTAAAPPSF